MYESNNDTYFEKEDNLVGKKIKINVNANENIYEEGNKLLTIEEKRIKKEDISTVEKLKKLLEKIYPKIFEIYEIVELIASGSESVVCKVLLKSTNKTLAMKLILIDKKEKRNTKEYHISRNAKNKNIISIYGVYEIKKDELDFIIMEYAKFGTLRDFQRKILKKERLSEQTLCFFALQILTGLQYCHKCKYAHYDIKPNNIVIDEYLNAKLIDFSISIDYGKINSDKIKLPFRGTSLYMAPEVIESKIIKVKDLNKVDVFSLGVLLYNMAFGYYPFGLINEDAKDYDIIYNKMQSNKLTFNNDDKFYSKYFIDFLRKLLRIDIDTRININQALNHYWIRGANILLDEKEKIFNASSFLINLITDHIKTFENYVNK